MKQADLQLPWQGKLEGQRVEITQKKYGDLKQIYLEEDATISNDTILYEVHSALSDPIPGHLNFGVTILHPFTIGDEYNMTKGHIHVDGGCEEYYWCMSGQGLLMLVDANGKTWCEEMTPGSVHHIHSDWAHRCINTGDTDLQVACCWGSDTKASYDVTFTERIKKGAE